MRIALGIEYDGSHFYGYQIQKNHITVQGELEKALANIANEPIALYCAGRTDRGVHAVGQVVHFDTETQRPMQAWVMGTNTLLRDDISVQWAQMMPDHFHARFSALSRRYQYIIANTKVRPAMMRQYVTWHYQTLDVGAMNAAAKSLLGEHDFSAFRSSNCTATTPMRHVQAIQVVRNGELVIVDIMANAFLHNMVRIIVGNLLAIGDGKKPIGWLHTVLASRQRTMGADTAPANGLCLVSVQYPDYFSVLSNRSHLLAVDAVLS